MKRALRWYWLLAFLLLPALAWAIPAAFRAGGGIRGTASSAPGTAGTAANPVLWFDNTAIPNLRLDDGTNSNRVAGCVPTTTGDYCSWNTSTGNWQRAGWPLQNGTSTNTYTSGVADGAAAIAHQFNTSNSFANATDELVEFDSNGAKKMALLSNDATTVVAWRSGGVSNGLCNYSTDNTCISIQSAVVYHYISGAAKWSEQPTFITAQSANALGLGIAGQEWQYVTSYQYRGISQAPTFSATVAVNCAASGETVHVGTVNANVTGATMTGGNVGQRCVIIWAKDATASAYTITWSGSNVRASSAEAMSVTASSLFVQTFAWDDRLGTPAWVETASRQTP